MPAEREVIADAPVVEEEDPVALLGPYRPHNIVVGAQMFVCLTCGYLWNNETRRGPGAARCGGFKPLPPFALQALLVGAFDAPILEGGGKVRELAIAQGWVHPGIRIYPLEPDLGFSGSTAGWHLAGLPCCEAH